MSTAVVLTYKLTCSPGWFRLALDCSPLYVEHSAVGNAIYKRKNEEGIN